MSRRQLMLESLMFVLDEKHSELDRFNPKRSPKLHFRPRQISLRRRAVRSGIDKFIYI